MSTCLIAGTWCIEVPGQPKYDKGWHNYISGHQEYDKWFKNPKFKWKDPVDHEIIICGHIMMKYYLQSSTLNGSYHSSKILICLCFPRIYDNLSLKHVPGHWKYDVRMTEQVPGLKWAEIVGRHLASVPMVLYLIQG